jgi:hypothetical protein
MSFNDICEFFIFDKNMSYYLFFVSLVIIFIIRFGFYHEFANIISNLVKKVFNIKNDNPYINIITFIIKLLVFVKLMNYLLKSALNSFFLNISDVPENKELYCAKQNVINKTAHLTSVTFFIVYYFFTLPHNIVLGIDDFYYNVVQIFDMVLKNSNKKKALNKSANLMDEIRIKIDEILNIYYEDLNKHLGGGILSFITNSLLNQLKNTNKNPNLTNKEIKERFQDRIRDRIASSYAGYLSITIPFILGCFYLLLYNFIQSFTLRIICFIIICYFYLKSSIRSFVFKVATKHFELVNSLTRAIADKKNKELFKDVHKLVCEEGKEFSIIFSPMKKLLKYVCNAKELREITRELTEVEQLQKNGKYCEMINSCKKNKLPLQATPNNKK